VSIEIEANRSGWAHSETIFERFYEADIHFAPTYKYVRNTVDTHDTKRRPAYTVRQIMGRVSGMNQMCYRIVFCTVQTRTMPMRAHASVFVACNTIRSCSYNSVITSRCLHCSKSTLCPCQKEHKRMECIINQSPSPFHAGKWGAPAEDDASWSPGASTLP
jgi:hypothetical protein